MHKIGYTHRDISSKNVLYTRLENNQIEPIIIDFGFAIRIEKIELFKDNYKTFAFDFKGQGKSHPSKTGYSLDKLTDETAEFIKQIINEKLKLVQMSPVFLSRNVNEGFSGGDAGSEGAFLHFFLLLL